jgi:hypothetical protein
MFSKLTTLYKTPLLLSLVLFVVLLAFRAEAKPLNIAFILLGAVVGTFFLDLDYLIYTYFLEPKADFSLTLAGFVKHKDFSNALTFVSNHRDDLKDKTLNSVLFQVVLGGLLIFVASSNTSLFVKALIFSAFLNSIYRMYEYYVQGKAHEWFWALKEKPSKNGVMVYGAALFVVLVYCLTFI